MNNGPGVYNVALAGLLHDVGKVGQRAHPSYEGLSETSRSLESVICPEFKGRYSHQHVLYTNEFCDRYVAQQNLPPQFDVKAVTPLAIYHHRPDTDDHKLIQEADWLSSGMDRLVAEECELEMHGFRKQRMLSVLGEMTREESSSGHQMYFTLAPLNGNEESLFPVSAGEERDGSKAYLSIWNKFGDQYSVIKADDPWGYIACAVSLIGQAFWSVPSATNTQPDISLFDHSKTTAAIGVALLLADQKERPFILLSGDFEGIQTFIFDIRRGKGALAKRLRARSYFVSNFSRMASFHILRSLGIPPTNLILSAGGKFTLLLPNSEIIHKALPDIRSRLDRFTMRKYHGELRLHLAHIEATKSDLKNFSNTHDRLSSTLENAKLHPLSGVLTNGHGWNPPEFQRSSITEAGDAPCESCGKHPAAEDSEEARCLNCADEVEDGRLLPKSVALAFHDPSSDSDRCPEIGDLQLSGNMKRVQGGPYAVFVNEFPDNNLHLPFVRGSFSHYIPLFHDEGCDICKGFFDSLDREEEARPGSTMTFEAIAAHSKGKKALAYLRADVDNLGFMFGYGLEQKKNYISRKSISRLATASRLMELFFTQWFERALKNRFAEIYTVYTGGDDVFCIGPWDQALDFAGELRDAFRTFTCGAPSWSLSVGVALASPHTPVLEGANHAERLLNEAKLKPGKDHISALGVTTHFSQYSSLMNEAKKVSAWLEAGVVNTSQLRRLLKYADMRENFNRTGDTRFFRYVPLLHYDLARNWENKKNNPRLNEAREWAFNLGDPENDLIHRMRFIIQYALYTQRG